MVAGGSGRSGGRSGGVAGRGSGRVLGRGRGRGGFSDSLTDTASSSHRGKGKDKVDRPEEREGGEGGGNGQAGTTSVHGVQPGAQGHAQQRVVAPTLDSAPALDGETCFICAEPVKLYSVPPCNHKTCHICAIRLRVLYKKQECTFCKSPSESLIFTSQTDKGYLSFNAQEIPFKDDRLHIFFESEQSRDETLVLLHFNCPDPTCEYAGASWPDLKAHVRSEHGRLFCDLCVRNSRIFVHEHTLYSSSELTQHIRSDHKHCEFCKMNFYSDDELYVHMRDRHEQCFICKRHDETRDEYHRDYAALERHFKARHFLCDAKECLEQKFVVFESEMDFKAHQVAEHGAELSSREKREALRLTANFHYDANSAPTRAAQPASGSTGTSSRGRPREDDADSGPSANRDPLAVSVLASRNHVPGAGGPANHQSRRAMFGSGLTSSNKIKEDEEAALQRAAAEEKQRQNQAFLGRVAEIVHHSEVKMHSFRTNLRIFQAGEMPARDLVGSIQSIVEDTNQVEVVVKGLVDLLDKRDQKQDLIDAWTTVQVEQTHFPSLGGGNGNGPTGSSWGANANLSTITRGQVRSIKNNSTAANRGVWANVERAAASGGSVYRNVARGTPARNGHFPSLSAKKTAIPGSAVHSAKVNATVRSTSNAPWAGAASGSSSGRATPSSNANAQAPTVTPYTVDASRNAPRNNQTLIRNTSSAFPALPFNANAARLAAQKKELFAHKRSNGNSGASTPTAGSETWARPGAGRIDSGSGTGTLHGEEDVGAIMLHDRLNEAVQLTDDQRQSAGPGGRSSSNAGGNASISSKKGKQQKKVLVTMGGVHRG